MIDFEECGPGADYVSGQDAKFTEYLDNSFSFFKKTQEMTPEEAMRYNEALQFVKALKELLFSDGPCPQVVLPSLKPIWFFRTSFSLEIRGRCYFYLVAEQEPRQRGTEG